jgi:hypothetical protein
MSTSETLPVSGVVVREENAFSLPPGLIEFAVGEAERVNAGQTIAVSFQNEETRLANFLLSGKVAQRALYQYIAGRGAVTSDVRALDAEIRAQTAALLDSVSSGRMAGLPGQSSEIKALLFHQYYTHDGAAVLLPLISRLDMEIAALESSVFGSSTALRADSPGLFSALTDGLEDVWTPDSLRRMTVSEFYAKSEIRPQPPEDGKGRLVRGWTWRFVCVMPAFEAQTLGSTAAIRFSDGFSAVLAVERVSPAENGECVVVFSGDRYIGRAISERRMYGELLYKEFTGVRIPWEGLRFDEESGGYYVYCLQLGRVVRKNVTLFSDLERDNFYLAEYYPDVIGSLLPGDEIIVAGKDLFDRRVLR